MDPATRRALVFVQVCFGLFPWLGKVAMEVFEPGSVLVWRLLAGTVVLGLVATLRHGQAVIPRAADLPALYGLSVLGIMANQILFLEGLQRSTAVNAGLLMCLIPVATCAIALLFKQERPTGRRLAGVAVAVAGVAWMFVSQGAAVGGGSALGDLFMALNAVSYSFYLVWAKPVLRRIPPLVVATWIFACGLATVPWLTLDLAWVPSAAEGRHWAALGGILLFPTVLAYLCNTVVLSRASASTTAVYVLLQPLIAAGLGIVVLGERPEATLLATAAAVLTGIWLVSTGTRPAAAVAPGS